ncbi:hypothetical protein [Candidatus Poriferisodalis sp.]|uniref:hypothetical protein n=1 Tax=Candidatus Poriferisodalis sp. TaxID=3101277 RepID=UPI003B02B83D
MRRLSAAILSVLCASALTVVLATPSGATGDAPVIDPPPVDKADDTDAADDATQEPVGDTDTTVDIPDGFEEDVNRALRKRGSPRSARWPCFYGFGDCSYARTDTGYLDCNGRLIDELGVRYDARNGYDSIHVVPTTLGRAYSPPGATESVLLYNAMHSCLRRHSLSVTVLSWTAIWHQLYCHLLGNAIFGGASWDLEGHRDENRNPVSWVIRGCNW